MISRTSRGFELFYALIPVPSYILGVILQSHYLPVDLEKTAVLGAGIVGILNPFSSTTTTPFPFS